MSDDGPRFGYLFFEATDQFIVVHLVVVLRCVLDKQIEAFCARVSNSDQISPWEKDSSIDLCALSCICYCFLSCTGLMEIICYVPGC